jgi:hypothetical protein
MEIKKGFGISVSIPEPLGGGKMITSIDYALKDVY